MGPPTRSWWWKQKPSHPDAKVAKALEQVLLEDRSAPVRSAAAGALEKWGTRDSIPALTNALKDSNAGVQKRAKRAIAAISARE
jgi:HEAT repeat protein